MQSFPDQESQVRSATPRPPREAMNNWNRRLHQFLGLYFLFFVWLFSFTGLLLNHSQWKFSEFWENRKQTAFDCTIDIPQEKVELDIARNIMKQLKIRGEIEWISSSMNTNKFDFRVSRPGQIIDIKTDLSEKKVSVKRIELNGWGIMRILHTFTGVRQDDNRNQRDWLLTKLWVFAMDATAIALILMVLSGYLMWFQKSEKLLSGIVLFVGLIICSLFCCCLRWF